ncbi:MAG: NTP transferase domain-containing protein [Christensenellales bacterium]|jgi:bifunctional UDP-N-acetylglucosamine pyrophosphorylase/glucosamine-1-phosphate N-acetyltransferase
MDKLALIMAAGEGTRMLSSRPKMLHKICGVAMVEYVLRALDPVCKEKYMIVGHGKERMMEHCHGQAQFVEQKPDGWGTGHAIRSCEHVLQGRHGQVIVTAGDMPLVLPETFARLMSEVERGAACAMLTDQKENPVGYGRVVRENGKVAAIVEQKELVGDQHLIKETNASVYCFDIDALLWALPKLGTNNNAHECYLTDAIGILYQGGHEVRTVPVLEKNEGMGINDRVQLAAADREMRMRINIRHMRAGVSIIDPEATYIQPDVTIGQDTVIFPNCSIEKGSSIDANCELRECRIVSSHIGANARLDRCVVTDAYVQPGERLGPFAVIGQNKPKVKI